MSNSNLSDITTTNGNTSIEEDGNDPPISGSRVHSWKSNSPAHLSGFSPVNSFRSSPPTGFSGFSLSPDFSTTWFNGFLSGSVIDTKKTNKAKINLCCRKKRTIGLTLLIGSFFLMNWWMLSRIQEPGRARGEIKVKLLKANSSTVSIREELEKLGRGRKPQKTIFARLLSKAAHALAENKLEPKDLWVEPYIRASSWTPCSQTRDWKPSEGDNGYLVVTANGGINQQRVAVCNSVAIARLLNATLVLPKFMYSSVWRDSSQFGDIYQEEHFIKYLKPDIRIVKKLPKELQSLDLNAIGSVVTDIDVVKEAKPSFYLKNILPILHRNRIVHFVGFGNRLASDPIPRQIQNII